MPETEPRKGDGAAPPPVSRREAMVAEGRDIEMPPLDCGHHFIDYLYEFGPTMAAGMGNGPVTFCEIEAWSRQVGIDLRPWEARLLRRLSNDYLSESHAATKRDRPPPYGSPAALKKSRQRQVDRDLDLFLA